MTSRVHLAPVPAPQERAAAGSGDGVRLSPAGGAGASLAAVEPDLAPAAGERAALGAGARRLTQAPIRVVLADDHALIRRSLRLALEGIEGMEVIAHAGDLAAAARHVHTLQPEVIVLDLRMLGGPSDVAIAMLRAGAPRTRVVVLTMHDSPAAARRALASGALGFVLKENADTELPQAVRAVARGEEYVSPKVAERLQALRQSLDQGQLTPREVEVLRLIAYGHTSVEIADKLGISPRTVESHRARVHGKLGLPTRAELVRYALGRGLLRQ